MIFRRTLLVGLLIPTLFFLLGLSPKQNTELPLPTGYNTLFSGSGECLQCHNSMTDSEGNDLGILSWWKSTMMANSSKDPFWRAKVSYEVIKNPELQSEIESTCTKCHAPQGNFDAHHNGQPHYSMAELYSDPIANDGVSCTVCHQITEESLGNFSGEILFGTNHEIYGPYSDIFPNPMINHTGYTPVYSTHIKDSKLCASCHTLFTPTVDLNGQLTGTYFPEQTIYQEWTNSMAFQNQVSCQQCHIPEIQEDIVISSMPPWLEGQNPFGKHELVGGNVFMLNLLKNNIEPLGLTASEDDFENTISRTLQKLQNESINLNLNIINRTTDSIFIKVDIENLAGHKIPSGYPSRQIFIQLSVANEVGETIFISGALNERGQIIHESSPYEPHHDIITLENQTQIYQMVMADVENNVTTTLLHADHLLKDNRLVPIGFSNNHFSYDTIAIIGEALEDANFNQNQNGTDEVLYHIPLNEYSGALNIEAKVFYQTVSDRWLSDLFNEESEEIQSFENMYNEADLMPVLMKSELKTSQALGESDIKDKVEYQVYPNPFVDRIKITSKEDNFSVNLYDIEGKLIKQFSSIHSEENIILDIEPGIYFIELKNKNEKIGVEKIIKI